jgi:hypothetical protein
VGLCRSATHGKPRQDTIRPKTPTLSKMREGSDAYGKGGTCGKPLKFRPPLRKNGSPANRGLLHVYWGDVGSRFCDIEGAEHYRRATGIDPDL